MKRARIQTRSEHAAAIAAAIRPDNTTDMSTRVEADEITTIIERDTLGGLQATVDDYVVNVDVATRIINNSNTPPPQP